MLRHNYIGTEHVLLGLLREEEGLAACVLESFGITVERVRAQVVRIVGSGEEVTSGQVSFTPRAKKILELALREALSLGHNYIGTEHILLGLVCQNEGVAARILLDFDADSDKIRTEVIRGCDDPLGLRRGPEADLRSEVIRRLARPGGQIDGADSTIDRDADAEAARLRDLWLRYKLSGDQDARDRLVVAYSPLVKYVVGRMASEVPGHVDEADLISYGMTGLIFAIERFDGREIKFETYAFVRIRSSIIDELRTLDWVPRSVRARAREIERANEKLVARFERTPTDEEMATETGDHDRGVP